MIAKTFFWTIIDILEIQLPVFYNDIPVFLEIPITWGAGPRLYRRCLRFTS